MERTGPDLSNVAARQPSETWHLLHLYNPRAVVPQSVMPGFPWYFEEKAAAGPGDLVVPVPPRFVLAQGRVVVARPEARASWRTCFRCGSRNCGDEDGLGVGHVVPWPASRGDALDRRMGARRAGRGHGRLCLLQGRASRAVSGRDVQGPRQVAHSRRRGECRMRIDIFVDDEGEPRA